ncbi:MAG: hypothetical protein KDM91_00120 [Verrucomicrobiae bacterium]|nr:hypothetical protein [Verrucomicrobiae bacterium]MCP5539815.1 hypothetical protein [Akkermansiaceae bacterium]
MTLSPPKKIVFYLSLILAVLALVFKFVDAVPVLHANVFWLAMAGWAVLATGTAVKGV